MIEVLKQALEALEKSNRFVWHYAHSKATARIAEQCDEAITSLRKAIQEEALRNVQRIGQEIEQEPVATLEDLEQEIYENTREFVSRRVMDWMLKRYYTHPPQRKPLTDEQAMDAYFETPPFGTYKEAFIAGIRFIEAAHGIKG